MGLVPFGCPGRTLLRESSATVPDCSVALGCADDGFNVVPRRVELLGCADDGFNVVPRRVELLFRE